MNNEQIIAKLKTFVAADKVVTAQEELEEHSIDLYRKWEQAKKIYDQATAPIAIVYVDQVDQVQRVLQFANEHNINVIPRTGGTDIEMGLESGGKEPHIILDGSGFNEIKKIDTENMQVTVGAGVPLQKLDDQLRAMGYTTGHSPQSKPAADMGGLVSTRSIGQFSTLYGGIEDMIVGLEGVLADGYVFKIKNIPRRAAGPDIRQIFVGGEGTVAFLTEVTVKLFKWQPENNIYLGWSFDQLEDGFKVMRKIIASGYKPSVARVYEKGDAALHFSDFIHDQHVLLFMTEGPKLISEATAKGIREIVGNYSQFTEFDGEKIHHWLDNLNWDKKRINDERVYFAGSGQVGYTTEVAAPWSDVVQLFNDVQQRVMAEIPQMQGISGHSSHQYMNGTNMYFVYGYWMKDVPDRDEKGIHDHINRIIVEETLKNHGTIVHHHGIGKARAPYIKDEYGSSYLILKKLLQAFDPNNTLNAGSIIPVEFWNEVDETPKIE